MPKSWTLPALLFLTFAGGCANSDTWIARSQEFYAQGNFYQAFYCLQAARAEGESADQIEPLYWPYRMAYLLKRAQTRVFQNEDAIALEDLAKVLAVDPENRIAHVWSRKARERLAKRAVRRGDERIAAGELKEALIEFHEALTYWPGLPAAEEGIQEVSGHWQRRHDKAQSCYLDGVRSLAEQLFEQTKYHMFIALDEDPTMTQAEPPRREAESRLIEERFRRAVEMETGGYFEAALREYQEIAQLAPGYGGLEERIAHVEREVEALEIARRGEIAVFRGDYEEARRLIDQAFDMSASQRVEFNDMLLLMRDREFEDKYLLAKDFELQGALEQAVTRYLEIDGEMDAFLDVRARIDNLQASIDIAKEYYTAAIAAESAGQIAVAVENLEEAKLHYAKFSDVRERLARLREQLVPPPAPPLEPSQVPQ